MKQSDMYMKKIKYTKVFEGVTYFDPTPNSNDFLLKTGSGNLRRIDFKDECGEGIIIGQTTKREGVYHKGYTSTYIMEDDSEPSWLEVKNTIPFWKVLVGFNNIILIPKSDFIEEE